MLNFYGFNGKGPLCSPKNVENHGLFTWMMLDVGPKNVRVHGCMQTIVIMVSQLRLAT